MTSRERLNLEEEWLLPLEGLPFPSDLSRPEEGLVQDAPHLFTLRARRARPNFVPTEADLSAIVRICRKVEGLPLATKLTAAWIRATPCGVIADELEINPGLLVNSLHNVPGRHKSMRRALEHSWLLLNTEQQAAMRRLAVFRGGFRRAAAWEVATVPLFTLVSPVDKSLLRVSPAGRYDRHPLVYSFSHDKLTEMPSDEAQARAKHADFYARLLEVLQTSLTGSTSSAALDKLGEELTNVEVAWRYWLEAMSGASGAAEATKRG